MTRRVRLLALVLGLLAVAVVSTGTLTGTSSSSVPSSTELRTAIVSTETLPAHLVSSSERREDATDRLGKLSRLVALVAFAVACLVSSPCARVRRRQQGDTRPIVPRARHLGRAPPELVAV